MSVEREALPVDEAVRVARTNSRRRQVLNAAVRVMERTGFHQMSMQALADEAKVSVGLIYKYFGGKEDVLQATIVDILEAFRDQLEPAIDAAGDDPIERFVAGLRRYFQIVDENLDAVVLTYRESRTLDAEGRGRIKTLEVETSEPIRRELDAAVDAGVVSKALDVDLVVFDAMMLAHGWALKHWHFAERFTIDEYIDAQLELVLRTVYGSG
ncbi:TetR/AcrR family transcriptional regulator [Rhodococcus sp. HNM0569]|uniref:TetR/AcrR family transcriptional regulator n=1 Tax=Rhodococcus sp. HNM0569 TaxID=2716340 RepID=UPI00146C377A|nr:TetR/AcrR family transcriptional regulator [Rhodococcus sp. HNM0569]NLU83633.1 TetR/AcrR family transcriptional regulator [Rhodococcus sp. HNM0569]